MEPDRTRGPSDAIIQPAFYFAEALSLRQGARVIDKNEVAVGKCYVNLQTWLLREVIHIDSTLITYNTYHLNTGQLFGTTQACQVEPFIHWADREATQAEMSVLPSTPAKKYEPEDTLPIR